MIAYALLAFLAFGLLLAAVLAWTGHARFTASIGKTRRRARETGGRM